MSNEAYKIQHDTHCKFREYNVSDYTLICISALNAFSKTPKGFMFIFFAPFKIVRNLGFNAYGITTNLNRNTLSDIEDLLSYQGTFESTSLSIDSLIGHAPIVSLPSCYAPICDIAHTLN